MSGNSFTSSPRSRESPPRVTTTTPIAGKSSSSPKSSGNNNRQQNSSSRSTNSRLTTHRSASRPQNEQHQQRMHYAADTNTSHHDARDHRQESTIDSRSYSDTMRSDESLLTWRLDPEESLSDWTIVVRSPNINNASNEQDNEHFEEDDVEDLDSAKNDFSVSYYYVHKTQLGVGPRKSEYFAGLFRSIRNSAGRSRVDNINEEEESRIELKPSAFAAFPLLLDYMYSAPGVPVNVSTECAVALRYLATCFGIRDLFSDVTEFIHCDFNVNTSLTYLSEAGIYNHEKLLGAAVKLCAANLEALNPRHLANLEPGFFQQIITSSSCNCESEILSSHVSSYLRCRPGSFSLSFLNLITPASKMPRISPEEALFLIGVLVQLGSTMGESTTSALSIISEDDSDDDKAGEDEEEPGMSLYERCAVAAVDALKRAVSSVPSSATSSSKASKNSSNDELNKSLSANYQVLPTSIKIDLLERSIKRLPETTTTTPTTSPTNKSTSRGDTLGDVLTEDARQLINSYTTQIDNYKTMLESEKEKIRVYAEELYKFKRVPVTHRTPLLITQCTFKDKQEYDGYGQSVYGDEPPTALPRIGEYEIDGWILKEDTWAENREDTRNWPMFYYKVGMSVDELKMGYAKGLPPCAVLLRNLCAEQDCMP